MIYHLSLFQKFADEQIDEDSRATVMKMILAFPGATFQLFLTCYLFEFLNNEVIQI